MEYNNHFQNVKNSSAADFKQYFDKRKQNSIKSKYLDLEALLDTSSDGEFSIKLQEEFEKINNYYEQEIEFLFHLKRKQESQETEDESENETVNVNSNRSGGRSDGRSGGRTMFNIFRTRKQRTGGRYTTIGESEDENDDGFQVVDEGEDEIEMQQMQTSHESLLSENLSDDDNKCDFQSEGLGLDIRCSNLALFCDLNVTASLYLCYHKSKSRNNDAMKSKKRTGSGEKHNSDNNNSSTYSNSNNNNDNNGNSENYKSHGSDDNHDDNDNTNIIVNNDGRNDSDSDKFIKMLQVQDFYKRSTCFSLHEDLKSKTIKDPFLSSSDKNGNLSSKSSIPFQLSSTISKTRILSLAFALIVFFVILFVPILKNERQAHSCLAMLTLVTVLWVSEALPFYVTALFIPPLTVVLDIFKVDDKELSAGDQAELNAKLVLSHMFDHTVALVLGGFALSSAFTKYGFEKIVISKLQIYFGHRPYIFLLMFMFLGWFLSMWISNVAAPVLCTSVILPIIRKFKYNSKYTKALLLGLAFACNIGGMLTPVSSPQNAIGIGYLANTSPEHDISFFQWILVSIPFCSILLIACWLYLLLIIGPDDVNAIPRIDAPKLFFSIKLWIVVITSVATAALWCTLKLTRSFWGDMGIVAFFPLCVYFSTGVLNENDFKAFNWPLVFLIMGGNVLGAAVKESDLLRLVVDEISPLLEGHAEYVVVLLVTSFVLLITTFVSHTVGSIMLTPVIVELGLKTGRPQILVFSAILMYSSAMALPMSSFPNINSLFIEDSNGRKYLRALDFLKYGSIFCIIVLFLFWSVGYFILWLRYN